MRNYLRTGAAIEVIVDFGDQQIFEGVTTYPIIATMRKTKPKEGHFIQFWNAEKLPTGSFADSFDEESKPYPQSALTSETWQLEPPELRALRKTIMQGHPTLRKVYSKPFRGGNHGAKRGVRRNW